LAECAVGHAVIVIEDKHLMISSCYGRLEEIKKINFDNQITFVTSYDGAAQNYMPKLHVMLIIFYMLMLIRMNYFVTRTLSFTFNTPWTMDNFLYSSK